MTVIFIQFLSAPFKKNCRKISDTSWLAISPIAQYKKPSHSPLRLHFLYYTLEEISCVIRIIYFSTIPKMFVIRNTIRILGSFCILGIHIFSEFAVSYNICLVAPNENDGVTDILGKSIFSFNLILHIFFIIIPYPLRYKITIVIT